MRLYSLSRRHVIAVFLSFLGCFLVSLTFGIIGKHINLNHCNFTVKQFIIQTSLGPQMLNTISTSAVNQSRSINLRVSNNN